MKSNLPCIPATTVEATVSSKGQITLPKALRNHLGLQTGSRLRFSVVPNGGFHVSQVLYDLEDFWKVADQDCKTQEGMSFEEMNQAKARRHW